MAYNREACKRYFARNRDKLLEKRKRWVKMHPERRCAIVKKYMNSIKGRRQRLHWNDQIRQEVLRYYSQGTMACVKCGFSDVRALQMDHIKGNGAQERRSLTGSQRQGCGIWFWQRLRSAGFPSGYQILCANCNTIKRFENREFNQLAMPLQFKIEESA